MSEEMVSLALETEGGRRLEALLVILLGIAAITIAWCSYESGMLSGDSLLLANRSLEVSSKANHKFAEGTLQQQADEAVFMEYASALDEGRTKHATYVHSHLMDPHLQRSVDWWHEQEDEPGAARTPFTKQNPDYEIEAWTSAEQLEARSKRLYADGKELDDKGDQFDLVTVLLAVAMFLFGVAALFEARGIRLGSTTIGLLLLVASLIELTRLGYYAGL